MTFRPSILVVGAGAIGGFYAGKLAQAGARVSLVCRSDCQVIKDHGIHVTSGLGDFTFRPRSVMRHASEFGSFADYVLVGTKVLPEVDVAALIREAVDPETAVVLIQNGIEIEEPVAKAFPQNEIVSGLAFIAVSRVGPGKIHHLDYGRLTLGCYPSGVSDKALKLKELFVASGVPCDVTPDVVTARWRKLVWNAPFNPISVLGGGIDTRRILDSPKAAKLVREIMQEICDVAKAVGHALPADVIQHNIDGTVAMKPYKTSMLLDYEGKRPMEVEAILGNAVRIAQQAGVPAARLETLYALLQLADLQNRARA